MTQPRTARKAPESRAETEPLTTGRAKGLVAKWRATNGPGKRQAALACAWVVIGIVIMATELKYSVACLSAVTLYTVVVGHWGVFQAATPTKE